MPIRVNNNPNEENRQEQVVVPAADTTPETIEIVHEPIEITPNNLEHPYMLNGEVEINDKAAPLIVLFGPTSCGKTMTLIRLTKFLRSKGMTVTPDGAFRPSYDQEYRNDCSRFNQTVNDPIAAPGTSGYMLVDVIYGGKVLCKILEAPGEYYFDPQNPNKQYPHYLAKIIDAPNRKVWCAFVEPNWGNATHRANYVTRIADLKPEMKPSDKMVFVFNKIDKLKYLIKAPGVVDEKLAIKHVSDNYPHILDQFKNDIPILSFFRPYNCYFVPFQTGKFTESTDSNQNKVILYSEGPEAYPARLWNIIRKSL